MTQDSYSHSRRIFKHAALLGVFATLVFACKGGGRDGISATSLDPPAEPDPPGDVPGFPLVDHVAQADITNGNIQFQELFVLGDELFEAQYNAQDGVGILRLPDGTDLPSRFSRVPPGGGRVTGPNAQACEACHNLPFGTAAGEAASNVVQDPAGAGVTPFNIRNAPSLFGSAVLQRLAEEMTEDLLGSRDAAALATTPSGPTVTRPLASKGISFGAIRATQDGTGVVTFDLTAVEGVDPDLVVRPYGLKGDTATLRGFARGAASGEMGMEPEELVAKDPMGRSDPDGDGVEREFSVGDITAITIYIGAQEIPTTRSFLVAGGFEPPPTSAAGAAARRGESLFGAIGCTECHIPELRLLDPVFEEPTLRGRGQYFDGDIDPDATALRVDSPFRFNLLREGDFPRLEPHPSGGARVFLLGDLKRHNMGSQLADAQPTGVADATGRPLVVDGKTIEVPEQVFLTAELWGAGDTGPWLHDGRAATLEEAILLHGVDQPPAPGDAARSEAQEARDMFAALNAEDRVAVVEFLNTLRHFSLPDEEE